MTEQKKKERDWSFLFPNGKPASKKRLELKKIKKIMEELEIDIHGFDGETEGSFRKFVMDKKTPGTDIEEFLKTIFQRVPIEYTDKGFKRLSKKDYLDVFFAVFALGINEGDGVKVADGSDAAASSKENNAIDDEPNGERDARQIDGERLTIKAMDQLYQTDAKRTIDSISYTDFIVTDQMPVRAQDGFILRLKDNAPIITHGRAALFNTHLQKTVAVGHLEGTRQEPKLVFSSKDIDYDSIKKNRSHEIILFPAEEKEQVFYAVTCELGFREMEETNRILCIDFGTSNTTAGSYGILDEQENQPEIVEFPDGTGMTTRRMIPTLVYIDSCEAGEPIRYAFGYEAKKRIINDHFESRATVFHEIKSWLNDLDREEEIFDPQGNNGKVSREEVIKAYLSHIIELSEQHFHRRFKRLHFSTPVKLKESFLKKMRQIFPKNDHVVLADDVSLDEGIAIVYNHIATRIKKMEADKPETVFIIDCGGGTTDLAKCEYSQTAASIDKDKKLLSVKTSFENGDSSFGGNNITYRILQLLKIKIDAFLQGNSDPDMLEILTDNEIDIMTKLDDGMKDKQIFHAKEALYQGFIAAYEAAEARIPTRYEEAKFNDDKQYMRRNYNYLWQMAESIKIEFYKSSSTVSVDFAKEEDRNLCIGGQEDYYLYVREGVETPLRKKAAPLGNIRITIKEINRIICPDIYTLLSILLGEYDNKTLQEVNYYKLSGQSCNIPLFHDLMKEFVPGRSIRRNNVNATDEDRIEGLKIACLEGSIRYHIAKDFSQIKPEIKMAAPKMLYKIYEVTGEEPERCVLSNESACLIRNFDSGRRIRFIVQDAYHQVKNSIVHNYDIHGDIKQESISLSDLQAQLSRDTYWSHETVNARIISKLHEITPKDSDEMQQVLFLLPAKNGYGFRIYQVCLRSNNGKTEYFIMKCRSADDSDAGKYQSLEQMASFFDGKR